MDNSSKQRMGKALEKVRYGLHFLRARRRQEGTEGVLPSLLTISEAARILSVHANTLRIWDQSGALRSVRVGPRRDRRFLRDEVLRLLQQRTPHRRKWYVHPRLLGFVRSPMLLSSALWITVGAVVIIVLLLRAPASAESAEVRSFQPQTCIGWKGATNAQTIDLSRLAAVGSFDESHAASYATPTNQHTPGTLDDSSMLLCDHWNVPDRGVGSTVDGVVLRVSYASNGPSDGEDLIELQTSNDGIAWTTRQTFLIRDETSNASNGGYFVVPLDDVRTADALRSLRVRFSPNLLPSASSGAVWVDGMTLDAKVKSVVASRELVGPAACTGWSNADAARKINDRATAAYDDFSERDAAVIERRANDENGMHALAPETATLRCSGFDVLRASLGKDLVDAKINLSFGARSNEESEDLIVPSYSIDDGQTWQALEPILVRSEVSNENHGGYWTYSLPTSLHRGQLANLMVQVTYAAGEVPVDTAVLLDGVGLDLGLERAPGSKDPDFGGLSFLTKHYFLPIEDPVIFLEADLQSIEVFDGSGKRVDLPYSTSKDNQAGGSRVKIEFQQKGLLRPGVYTVRLRSMSGRISIEETETFSWGIVSVNTPKTTYAVDENIPVAIGIVDSYGATVCNADITATVSEPSGGVITAQTKDGSISGSNTCGADSVTAEPDYLFRFRGHQQGVYRVHVVTQSDGGPQAADLDISVGKPQPFVVERVGPSRINPRQPYLMHLFITPAADYTGSVSDTVPASFALSQISDGGKLAAHDDAPTTLSWNVDWKAGKEYELTYAFDAPDVSPMLFMTGPAAVGDTAAGPSWQIASDQVIERSDPSVQYASVPFDDASWSAEQSRLIQPKDAIVVRGTQAVVELWSKGFITTAADVPAGITPGLPLTITSTVLKGPDGSAASMPNVTEIVSRDGRERRMWYLIPDASTKPGTYTVESTVSDGTNTSVMKESFDWGTLDIDMNGSSLAAGTGVSVGLRSVNADGSPQCDREVHVKISGPSNFTLIATEKNGSIVRNGACAGGSAVDPEYLAAFTPEKEGRYVFELVRTRAGVAQRIEESFTVQSPPAVPDSTARDMERAVSVGKKEYRADERPQVAIETRKGAVFGALGVDATDRVIRSVSLVGPDRKERPVKITGDSKKTGRSTVRSIGIDASELVKPGKYVLRVTLTQDGNTYTTEQDFMWGVLAINVDRSIEKPDSSAVIGMAVLDDVGATICNASVELEIENPKHEVETFSTKQGAIATDPACVDKGVTNNPDYRVDYRTGEPGTYTMRMTAVTPNGTRTTQDTFDVRGAVPFDVQRTAFPTRVYPLENYVVSFTIVPSVDYHGTVVETVPDVFVITDTSEDGVLGPPKDGAMSITWNVDWRAGASYTLDYTIDFPDVSPEYYRLGPLQIGDFREARQWQIASDATSITVSGNLYSDEGTTAIRCDLDNKTVKVEVNNSAQYSGTCTTSDGAYSVGGVSVNASDVVTIYLSGETEKGARTTRVAATPADITGAHIYQNRAIVAHEDAGPITNTNLDNWDSGNDSDVPYAVTGGALTVADGRKLIVWTGDTFTPGGSVTTTAASNQSNPDGDLAIQSSATLSMGTNALSVGGDYANSGTFSKSTGQTTTFTGTTTGFTIAPGTSSNFDSLTFNGIGGGWTVNAAQTVDVTLTLTDGAVTIDGDMTITTSLSVAANKTLTINSGKTVTLAAASGTSLTLNGTIAGAGRLTYQNTATPFPATGTISSILRMDATNGNQTVTCATAASGGRTFGGQVELYSNSTSARTITLCGSASHRANFSSHLYVIAANSANVTLEGNTYDPTVSITGDFDYTGSGAGSEVLSIGMSSWTVSGSMDITGGTITNQGGSSLTMNGNNTNISLAGYQLGNCTFSPPDGGTINVTGTTYCNNAITIAANKTVNIASTGTLAAYIAGSTISLAGTISGDGTLLIRGTNVGLTSAGDITVKYIQFRGDAGNQTVPARTYGKAGGEVWFFHVSTTSYTQTLGAGTFNILGNLFIKAQSSGTLTIDGTVNDPDFNISGNLYANAAAALQVVNLDGGTWTVSNDATLSNLTWNASGGHTLKLDAALDGAATLTSGGKTINNLEINSSGTVTLAAATHTVAGNLVLGGAGTPTVAGATIALTGTGKTIDGGGKTLNNLTISGTATLQNTDLAVSGALAVSDAQSLTVNAGRTLTLSANSGTSINLNTTGTVNGPGRLTYQNSATTFTTGGTLAATLITRFDTVNGNMVIPARTDYGVIEAYGGSANARTVTLGDAGSQTITASSHFYVIADAVSPNHVTIQGATWDPTLNVGGDFDFTGSNSANEQVTAPDAAATWTVNGNVDLTDGTWTTSAETLRLGGTSSATLNTACTDVTSCTTTKLNNLTINKTAAGDSDDNVTLTTTGVRLAGTLTVTDGELIQGAQNVSAEGATAVTIDAAGKWTNISTGDLRLGGTFTNAGTAVFNSNNGTQCVDGNDDIAITSTSGGTQRLWTNSGTLTLYNVSATDMTDSSVTAYTSTLSNTTWTAGFCGVTISGNIYTDDGTTALDCSVGGARTVAVKVNGTGTATGSCSLATGAYQITGISIASAGDVVTVFLYGASEKAATVTLAADTTSNISSLPLRTSRLVTTHENAGPITNSSTTGIGRYDKDDDGTNLFFTANSNNLVVDNGYELVVNAGSKTYTPGGTVTTTAASTTANPDGDAVIQSGSTLTMAGNALSVGGDFTNSGTFSKSSGQTTTFTATGAGFTITPGTGNFANVTFNGSGGDWTPQAALNIDETLTMTAGQLKGTQDVTVIKNAVGTAGTINLTGGTFLQRVAAAQNFGPTTASTTWTFYDLTFSNSNGTTAYAITAQSCATCGVTVTDVMRIGKSGDTRATTLSAGNKTWTVSGGVLNPLILLSSPAAALTASTSTVSYTGVNGGGNVNIANATYYSLNCAPAAAETYDVGSSFTISSVLTVGANCDYAIANGQTTTLTASPGASLNLVGTISGAGTLVYENATAFPTGGTISSNLSFQPLTTSTITGRTYDGNVDCTPFVGNTCTLGSGSLNINGNLNLIDIGDGVTLNGAAANPGVTLNGDFGATSSGGLVTFSMGSGTWYVDGDFNLTDVTTFAHNGGTLVLDGTSQQTVTANGQTLNNLTITNYSGSDPDSSPSVIFADSAQTAGTFYAATAYTKLKFHAGSTYTFQNLTVNGQSADSRIYLHSSAPGTPWYLKVAGTRGPILRYFSVKDSDACQEPPDIDASEGTNIDEGNSPCWLINTLTVSLSANTADLGSLSATQVNQGYLTSTVTTNAGSGYLSLVKYDQTLTSGSNTIPAEDGDNAISAGTPEYGASTDDSSNVDLAASSNACVTGNGPMNATALSTVFKVFASESAAVSGDATQLCFVASSSGIQQPGTYRSTVTIVTTAKL